MARKSKRQGRVQEMVFETKKFLEDGRGIPAFVRCVDA
jgi:hypothetical protein